MEVVLIVHVLGPEDRRLVEGETFGNSHVVTYSLLGCSINVLQDLIFVGAILHPDHVTTTVDPKLENFLE